MDSLAYNAGDVEATLTVDRRPFQRGLDLARDEARRFARDRYEAKVGVDKGSFDNDLDAMRAQIAALGNNEAIRFRIDVDEQQAREKMTALRAQLGALGDTAVRVDVDIADGGLDLLTARLGSLSGTTVQIDADTGTADAAITQLLTRLSGLSGTSVDIDVQTGTASAAIDGLIVQFGQLTALSPVAVRIDLDGAAAALAALALLSDELTELGRMSAEPSVDVQGGAAALAQMAAIRAAMAALDGSTATVNVNTNQASQRLSAVADQIGNVGSRFGLLAAGPPAIASIAAAALAAVPQVLSLGSSAMELVGVIGLMPAAGAAAATTLATIGLGLSNLGDALGPTGTAAQLKKVNEALAAMSPAGREVVGAIRGLQPAWDAVRLDVQEALLTDLTDTISGLGSTYLPVLQQGLSAVATELNVGARGFAAWAQSADTVSDVNTILASTRATMEQLAPAGTNVAAALTDIAVVGSGLMPELAAGAADATGRFRELVATARETGELRTWIQGGLDTLAQLGSVAVNTGSALSATFDAAEASGADFLGNLDMITERWDAWASSTQGQSQMITFFNTVEDAARRLLPGLEAIGVAFRDAFAGRMDGLSAMTGAMSDLLVSIAPVVAGLSSFAASVIPAVAGAVGQLSGALTVAAVGAGAVMVAMKGFALWTAYAAGVAALSTSLQVASVSAAAFVGSMTGSATAALAAGRATLALGTAVGAVGRALPLVAVGLVGLNLLYNEFGSKAEESAQKIINGSQTIQQAMATEIAQVEKNALFWTSSTQQQDAHAAARARVTEEFQRQYDALSPMGKLQADVSIAQANLNEAVAAFGPHSREAADAGSALAEAERRLKDVTDGAAAAAMSHVEAIQAQNDAMRSQISTAFAYEDAVRRTADANQAAADSLAANGAESGEYRDAVTDLARAMDEQAAAASAQAEAVGGAGAGAAAYAAEILRAADVSTTQGRDAFIRLASVMDNAGLAALSSTAQMSGLKTEIITLPDGRTVTVVAAAERSQLDSVVTDMDALARTEYVGTIQINGDARPFQDGVMQSVTLANGTRGFITLDGNDEPIRAKIGGTKYTIDATTGIMTIDGNPAPGDANLTGLRVRVDQTTGVMSIDANPALAQGDLQGTLNLVNGATGTLTLDANGAPASAVLNGTKYRIDTTTGVLTIDGNPAPGQADLSGLKALVDRTTGQLTIVGRDGGVAALKAQLSQPSSSRHTIYVMTQEGARVPGRGTITRSEGGISIPMANGGVLGRTNFGQQVAAFAEGGYGTYMGQQLTPMPTRATVVPPNTWRVVGDNMTVPEVYAPLNGSAASLSYLRYGVQDYGLDVVPQAIARAIGFAEGGLADAHPLGDLSAWLRSTVRGPVSTAMSAVRGTGGQPDVVRAIARLEAALATMQRAGTTIDARTTNIGDTAIARASDQARKLRTMAAQGMFD